MKIRNWQIIVLIVCLALGTLLHFTYEWSGENQLVALFSAVNESTWEHLKLLFFPMILMGVLGYFVIGTNFAVLNIGSFVVAILLETYVTYRLLKSPQMYNAEIISIILLILLLSIFVIYTFNPPQIPLFQDPISGGYGV